MATDLVPVPKEGINALFRELRKEGIIARQNFLCCMTCGFSAMANLEKQPRNATKVGEVFYHSQKADDYKEDGNLMLHYGTTDYGAKQGYSSEDVGRIVTDAATKLGLPWRWNGDSGRCICIGNRPVN